MSGASRSSTTRLFTAYSVACVSLVVLACTGTSYYSSKKQSTTHRGLGTWNSNNFVVKCDKDRDADDANGSKDDFRLDMGEASSLKHIIVTVRISAVSVCVAYFKLIIHKC